MAMTDQPRKNTYLRIDGKVFFVLDRQLKTQGRQGGLVILKLRSMDTWNNSEITLKSGTKVEEIDTETKEVQYLYMDDSNAYFMDTATFDTVTVAISLLEGYTEYLKEGEKTLILLFDNKVIDIKRKPSVDLRVVESEEGVKGNTANAATKQAKLETGYKLNVPLFVKVGDIVSVNTETGLYTGRVSS